MSNKYSEEQIREKQLLLFGPRYVGASLSKIQFAESDSEKLNRFIKSPKNFLVFLGSGGIGKTYFCASLVPWAMNTFDNMRYWMEEKLFKRLRECIASGSGDYLRDLELMTDDDLVIIDDLGISAHNEWREEVLFDLIDSRYRSGKCTVFTSNLSVKEFMKKYHYRVSSRLFATENIIVEIHNGTDKRQEGL